MNRLCQCVTAVLLVTTPALSPAASDADVPPGEQIASSMTRAREHLRPIENPIAAVEQLSGLLFHWKPEYGGESDLDCFPSEDLATSFPELIQWEVPGQVISGIRHDRLAPLLVEATKQIEVQMEDCYILLHALAEQFRQLDLRVGEHGSRLTTHQTSIDALETRVAAQECTIIELQQKDKELEQATRQLRQELEELKAVVEQLRTSAQ